MDPRYPGGQVLESQPVPVSLVWRPKGSGVSNRFDTRRNGRSGFSRRGPEKRMSTRIDTLSNGVDASGDGRQKTLGGMRGPGMQAGQGGTASGGGWGMEWHGICWKSSDVPPVKTAGARIGTVGTAGGRTPWNQREGGREACICRWWYRFCGGGGGGGPTCEGGRTLRGGEAPG
jgi:hypothetical protein